MKMTITNTSRASQGVHTTKGLAFVEAGQTVELDVADGYLPRLENLPFFKLNGEAEAETVADDVGDGTAPDISALRAANEQLSADLGKANAEVTSLKDKIAELELENEELAKRVPPAVPPEAKHRGAGSYSIMDGETEIREKLTKEQADAFNALDGEGRAKWLAENPKADA